MTHVPTSRFRGVRRAATAWSALLSLGLAATGCGAASQGLTDASPNELARIWDAEHISPALPPLVSHADVVAHVQRIVKESPDLFAQEEIGRSLEGRSLHHVTVGKGKTHVLLWSQMHGDEPTATSALFDLHAFIRRHRETPLVRRLLDTLTLHIVPMLNPDGAARYQRRNAQDIDINRDALRLQTPEGRALKALRDRLQPSLGFNLHNQNWRTSVGSPPKPATISLLAVAFDEQRSDNPGRILAKKTSAVIRDALEPFIPGQIGRYDDEFEVRAFGDNVTKWGTPVVLIETGPAPGEKPDETLVRMNFVALVTALDALASGRVNQADPKRYETLPFNESKLLHTVIVNATIQPGTAVEPFIGDVGISGTRVVRERDGQRTMGMATRIDDIGDLRTSGALNTIDAQGLRLTPIFDEALKEGDPVKASQLAAWASSWKGATVTIGQPANFLLLQPAGDQAFTVKRVIRLTEIDRRTTGR